MATDNSRQVTVTIDAPSGGPATQDVAIAISSVLLISFGIAAGLAFILARSKPLSARSRVQIISALVPPGLLFAALIILGSFLEGDLMTAIRMIAGMNTKGWIVLAASGLLGWLGAHVVYRVMIRRGLFGAHAARAFD